VKWTIDKLIKKSRWAELFLVFPQTVNKRNTDFFAFEIFQAINFNGIIDVHVPIKRRLQFITLLKQILRTALIINQIVIIEVMQIKISIIYNTMNVLKSLKSSNFKESL
jgi:hypothetical protein